MGTWGAAPAVSPAHLPTHPVLLALCHQGHQEGDTARPLEGWLPVGCRSPSGVSGLCEAAPGREMSLLGSGCFVSFPSAAPFSLVTRDWLQTLPVNPPAPAAPPGAPLPLCAPGVDLPTKPPQFGAVEG